MSDKPTTIKALLSKLEIELMELIQGNNPDELFQVRDFLFTFFAGKKQAYELFINAIESIKKEKAKDVAFGEEFYIGLRKFKKEKVYTISSLDVDLLEQVVPDKDNQDLFFDKKPKSQTAVKQVLGFLGLNVDFKQLYSSKEKEGEFKVKELN